MQSFANLCNGFEFLMNENRFSNFKNMTIKNFESMQSSNFSLSLNNNNNTTDKVSLNNNNHSRQSQVLTTSSNASNKSQHISFSVASLLADTRPQDIKSQSRSRSRSRSPSPSNHVVHNRNDNLSILQTSDDEDFDSNLEEDDSIVDIEDLNGTSTSTAGNSDQKLVLKSNVDHNQQQSVASNKDFSPNHGPVRPTPFSAIAAAVYQATHQSWASQGLIAPFSGAPSLFQASPFGISSLSTGKHLFVIYFVKNAYVDSEKSFVMITKFLSK